MAGSAIRAERLAGLIDGYSRRTYSSVVEQQDGGLVYSGLGAWLLLAACVSGASGDTRASLENALGCSADDASELLSAFMADTPSAAHAAIAIWVRAVDATEALAEWVRGLPPSVQSGFMPTQAEAHAWADRETFGLIKKFPIDIDALTRVVLASALATKVSWQTPFDVAAVTDASGQSRAWVGVVSRVLWDRSPGPTTMIARTQAAGTVAVHIAVAVEDLAVVSVSASPDVGRAEVLDAAHEVAALAFGRASSAERCSLFDVS